MTLTKITRNYRMIIKSLFVQATNLISTIMNASLALKEPSSRWLKRAVEPVRLVHSSTRIRTTAKRSLSTPTFKTLIGRAPDLTLIFKRKLTKRLKTHCTRSVLSKNHFQLENNAFSVVTTNTLTMTSSNVQTATMASTLTRTSTTVHTLKATSKQILKRLQNLSLKADQRTSGCTFTTKTLSRMMD